MDTKKAVKDFLNEENKKIKVETLIEKSKDFLSGKISQEEMAEFGDTISVKSYIPILDKMRIVMSIVNQQMYSSIETQEIKMVELYKNIFFYIILQEYGGIDCHERENVTYTNYDLLYPIFAPFILSYCKEDYDIIISMLKDSITLYQTQGVLDSLQNIETDSLKENTESNKGLIESLKDNKDLIENLKEISIMNNPSTKKLMDEISKIVLDKQKVTK